MFVCPVKQKMGKIQGKIIAELSSSVVKRFFNSAKLQNVDVKISFYYNFKYLYPKKKLKKKIQKRSLQNDSFCTVFGSFF